MAVIDFRVHCMMITDEGPKIRVKDYHESATSKGLSGSNYDNFQTYIEAYKSQINNHYIIIFHENDDKREEHKNTCLDAIQKIQDAVIDPIFVGITGEEETQDSEKIFEFIFNQQYNQILNKYKQEIYIPPYQKIYLDNKLKELPTKAANLLDRGFIDEAECMNQLNTDLEVLSSNYFSAPTPAAYNDFKTQSLERIEQAKQDLQKHPDIICILQNVALAILGLVVFYAVAVAFNGGLFFNHTASTELLTGLGRNINRDTYKINS